MKVLGTISMILCIVLIHSKRKKKHVLQNSTYDPLVGNNCEVKFASIQQKLLQADKIHKLPVMLQNLSSLGNTSQGAG